jgi:adenylate cyclase
MGHHSDKKAVGVRKTLLLGIFWRILIIEIILLVGTLLYEAIFRNSAPAHLFWYALRILGLVVIIILFMVFTLQRFLKKKIIAPLEAIAAANENFMEGDNRAGEVVLPRDTPMEIKGIVSTRGRMLDALLKVSRERLKLADFIRDTFGRYLTREVVDEIIKNPAARRIGGQRKMVTVLMSDLRGFTSMSESMDAEELVQLLNRYLARMTEIIVGYQGMIDEFIGDAILAVFGLPEKKEDDPERAVACALSMQNELNRFNDEMKHEGFPPLEMGIGINTGEVIAGNIGSEVRTKYGIMGPVVNRAARIESNTVGGQVLIGEETYVLVRDGVTTDAPRSVMMKGLQRPLVYYSVTAVGPPHDVSLRRTESPEDVEIHLPFRFWKVEGKKIGSESGSGETVLIKENLILATVSPPIAPMTDIKLVFEFCAEAHCFDDVYAKALPPEAEDRESSLHRFRITSMNRKDREMLREWVLQAS